MIQLADSITRGLLKRYPIVGCPHDLSRHELDDLTFEQKDALLTLLEERLNLTRRIAELDTMISTMLAERSERPN